MTRVFATGMAAGLFVVLGAAASGASPAPRHPSTDILAALPAERAKASPSAERDERPARRRLTPCLAGAWPSALARCMASPAAEPRTRHA
jgi:hypothetical protein